MHRSPGIYFRVKLEDCATNHRLQMRSKLLIQGCHVICIIIRIIKTDIDKNGPVAQHVREEDVRKRRKGRGRLNDNAWL